MQFSDEVSPLWNYVSYKRGSLRSLKNLIQVQIQIQNIIQNHKSQIRFWGHFDFWIFTLTFKISRLRFASGFQVSIGFLEVSISIFSRFFVASAKVGKSWIFIGAQNQGDFWTLGVKLSHLSHSQNFISFSRNSVHFRQILNQWSYKKKSFTKSCPELKMVSRDNFCTSFELA